MGRNPSQAPVKCGVCGKLSYLRDRHQSRNPQIRNDRYREYSRWEHIDRNTAPKSHYKKRIDTSNYQELLKQISITDEEFGRLSSYSHDTIPLLAEYNLTFKQFEKLSPAEKEEYLESRDKYISFKSGDKILDKIQRIEQEKLRELIGIKTIKDQRKASTIKPPKKYWGESNTRYLLLKKSKEFNIVSKCLSKPPWKDAAAIDGQLEISKYFKILSKQMNKLASLLYYFKPSPEADNKSIKYYNKWYEKSIKLIYLLLKHLGLLLDRQSVHVNSNNERLNEIEASIKLKYQFQLISDVLIGSTTIMKYIVDERHLLTFSGWLNVLVDRYKNYSIGGTAKNNLLKTGEYVYKLSTNQDEIDKAKKEGKRIPKFHYILNRIPVAISLTTKQIKNMTKLNSNLVQDLLNVLQGIRAQMELGITEKDEEIYDLIPAIGSLSRGSFPPKFTF